MNSRIRQIGKAARAGALKHGLIRRMLNIEFGYDKRGRANLHEALAIADKLCLNGWSGELYARTYALLREYDDERL